MIGFRRTQNITPIGLFYKNMGRLWRGVCLCEDLVGVTWRESDCEDLVGVNWSLSDSVKNFWEFFTGVMRLV